MRIKTTDAQYSQILDECWAFGTIWFSYH